MLLAWAISFIINIIVIIAIAVIVIAYVVMLAAIKLLEIACDSFFDNIILATVIAVDATSTAVTIIVVVVIVVTGGFVADNTSTFIIAEGTAIIFIFIISIVFGVVIL